MRIHLLARFCLTSFALAALIATPVLSKQSAALPRLRVQGTKIVDASGREVLLRGVNLGGWLVEEMWMTPWVTDPPAGSSYPKVQDHVSLWATLEGRLGAGGASAVRTAYRNAWIQPSDFARIREAGFNHVRLPFLASLLSEPDGMSWLRRAVSQANANGLYVILDMHGAPGGQNDKDHSGQEGLDRFFRDPENVTRAEKVWAALAREFGKNPGVAGFDLLNEPMSAPNPATLHVIHDRLYRAIRKSAPVTMVIVEDGYKGFETTPHADVCGWTDLVYSLHFYNFDAKKPEDHLTSINAQLPHIRELRGYRNAPVYIGEFNIEPNSTPETMAAYTRLMEDNGLSWAMWTYKTVARGGPMGFWGYVSNARPVNPLDPFRDSEAELIRKIGQVRTEHLTVPRGLADSFRGAAPEPKVAAPDQP